MSRHYSIFVFAFVLHQILSPHVVITWVPNLLGQTPAFCSTHVSAAFSPHFLELKISFFHALSSPCILDAVVTLCFLLPVLGCFCLTSAFLSPILSCLSLILSPSPRLSYVVYAVEITEVWTLEVAARLHADGVRFNPGLQELAEHCDIILR